MLFWTDGLESLSRFFVLFLDIAKLIPIKSADVLSISQNDKSWFSVSKADALPPLSLLPALFQSHLSKINDRLSRREILKTISTIFTLVFICGI